MIAASARPTVQQSKTEKPKPPLKILHQKYFKSVGPRTYAAQVKEVANGNHMLVLIEGRRDPATGDVRKNSICVFAEDFPAFFKLVQESADFTQANPLAEQVRARRARFWAKQASGGQDRGKTEVVK